VPPGGHASLVAATGSPQPLNVVVCLILPSAVRTVTAIDTT
jgi:hypothetical protein